MKINTKNVVILKFILSSIALCIIMVMLMMAQIKLVPMAVEALEEKKSDMPNTIWLVEYVSVILPSIISFITLTLFFRGKKSYVAVLTQRVKAASLAITLLAVYLGALPVIIASSPGWNDPRNEAETLFEKSAVWFAVQLIPFVIAITYHLIKASNEKKELAEAAEGEDTDEE